MALSIPTPDYPSTKQNVTLAGRDYELTIRFNERDSRWRLSISLNGVVVISGIKLVENRRLLSRYILPDFNHGDLFCMRRKSTKDPVGRKNLGIGKEYELIYFSNEELS